MLVFILSPEFAFVFSGRCPLAVTAWTITVSWAGTASSPTTRWFATWPSKQTQWMWSWHQHCWRTWPPWSRRRGSYEKRSTKWWEAILVNLHQRWKDEQNLIWRWCSNQLVDIQVGDLHCVHRCCVWLNFLLCGSDVCMFVSRVWCSLDKLITSCSQMRGGSAASVGPPATCLALFAPAVLTRWLVCTTPNTSAHVPIVTSHSSESPVTKTTEEKSPVNFTATSFILIYIKT